MTTATSPAPPANGSAPGRALSPREEASRVIQERLHGQIKNIEAVLPDLMKGQAERLVKRALLTFARKPDLLGCTPASFVRCVLDAAELGLAVDGRLGHAVKFSNKVKVDGREQWVDEAQFMPDYKGLLAVAKRCNILKDARADVVCENDHFEAWRDGPNDHLVHRRDLRQPRGSVYAAYVVLVLPDGEWRYELMDLDELNHVRSKSKSYTSKKGPSGPWVTDPQEMQKKTVVKRALKFYADDPAVVRALELDDRDAGLAEEPSGPASLPTGRFSLRPPPAGGEPAGVLPAPEDVPGDPEPPEDAPPSDEDLERLEMARVLSEQIRGAANLADLDDIARDLEKQRDWLGAEAHAALFQGCQQRQKELAPKKK